MASLALESPAIFSAMVAGSGVAYYCTSGVYAKIIEETGIGTPETKQKLAAYFKTLDQDLTQEQAEFLAENGMALVEGTGKFAMNYLTAKGIQKFSAKLLKKCREGVSAVTDSDALVAEKIKTLPTVRTKLGVHCIERCLERGITKAMAEKTIEKGVRYYDPKNHSIAYVLRHGMASGDHLILAVIPETGLVKTIFTKPMGKSLPKRLVPIK